MLKRVAIVGTWLPELRPVSFCSGLLLPPLWQIRSPRPNRPKSGSRNLFENLVGSTALTDSQDAERIRALLNRFYDQLL